MSSLARTIQKQIAASIPMHGSDGELLTPPQRDAIIATMRIDKQAVTTWGPKRNPKGARGSNRGTHKPATPAKYKPLTAEQRCPRLAATRGRNPVTRRKLGGAASRPTPAIRFGQSFGWLKPSKNDSPVYRKQVTAETIAAKVAKALGRKPRRAAKVAS